MEAEVVAAEKKASEESHVELPVVVEEVEATVKIDEAKADVPVEVEVVKVESEVLVSAVVEETKDEPNTILPAEAKEDVKPKVPEKVDEAPVEGSEIVETPDEVVKIAENIVEESACVKEKENSDTTAPKAKSSLFSFFKKAEKSTVEDAPADGNYIFNLVPASIVSKVEATDNVPVEQNSDVVKPKSSRKTKFSFNPFKILNAQKPDVPPKESEVEVVESIADVPAESKAQDVTPVDEEIAVAETKVEPAAITEEVVAEVVSTLEENPAVVSDSQEIKMKAAENSEETIAPQTTEQ